MSRQVGVPDWGASGSLYQQVEVAEPGDPGYPAPELAEGDPWAPAVNAAIREIEAAAADSPVPYTLTAAAEALLEAEPEPEPEAEP